MPRIYKLSRVGPRFLYKVRHHRGHGIHSPFVFKLITRVVEEKTPYYKYKDIEEHIDNQPQIGKYKISKYDRLSFRLINYFETKKILEIGTNNGINTLFLTAPDSSIECAVVQHNREKAKRAEMLYKNWNRSITLITGEALPDANEKQDCIYIDLNSYNELPNNIIDYLRARSHEKTFIVVKGIRTNRKCKTLWRDISMMEERTAMLDFFNLGIVFFRKELYRWDYQISF